MTYVARFTTDPEADIKRGWSGWMGVTYSSLKSAVNELLGDVEEVAFGDIDDLGDDELADMLSDAGRDVRFDEAFGEYRLVHHEGLSCFRLDAQTLDEAVIEQHPDAIGEGWKTVGTVRHICEVASDPGWHIFECDDAIPE